uniref:tRNA-specific 2-thiouridylase MnmA n=1 Tax=candidate division WOR-3 bacterium TaxID=2052148 RepID=A0A7C4UBI4_UNCW3
MRVLVGMSGGVDSSTACYLLKEKGFDIEGVTMLFRGVDREDIEFAKKSCDILGIKHNVLNFEKEYEEIIIKNFIEEYRSGRTPNPCVICNESIKFGLLMEEAKRRGFDYIATGHYAIIEEKDGIFYLKRGIDKNEQSYFLYRLKQEQLKYILFPCGNYTKEKIREIAKRLGLPTANRKKSQDVCFLPEMDYREFLKGILKDKPGPIIKDGKVIGEHKGISNYTYGQRKGIGISYKKPLYVIKISPEENAIYVGERKEGFKKHAIIRDINIISPFDIEDSFLAKSRYKSEFSKATCRRIGDRVEVEFEKPQWALTPGQSLVLFKDDYVIGGGIIEEVR